MAAGGVSMAKRTIAPRQERNDTASQMNSGKGFWLDYEHLRLAVQSHEGHWQAFVFDRKASLVLYRVERNTTHGAKVAAVEFALFHAGSLGDRSLDQKLHPGSWNCVCKVTSVCAKNH